MTFFNFLFFLSWASAAAAANDLAPTWVKKCKKAHCTVFPQTKWIFFKKMLLFTQVSKFERTLVPSSAWSPNVTEAKTRTMCDLKVFFAHKKQFPAKNGHKIHSLFFFRPTLARSPTSTAGRKRTGGSASSVPRRTRKGWAAGRRRSCSGVLINRILKKTFVGNEGRNDFSKQKFPAWAWPSRTSSAERGEKS